MCFLATRPGLICCTLATASNVDSFLLPSQSLLFPIYRYWRELGSRLWLCHLLNIWPWFSLSGPWLGLDECPSTPPPQSVSLLHTLPQHMCRNCGSGIHEGTVPYQTCRPGGCLETAHTQSGNSLRVLSPLHCLSPRILGLFNFPRIPKHLFMSPGAPLLQERGFFFCNHFLHIRPTLGWHSTHLSLSLLYFFFYLTIYINGASFTW